MRRERGLVRLAHPLRDPRGVRATLRSGLLDPRGLAALARWAAPALVTPRRVVRGPDRSLREGLDAAGVHGPLRDEVLEVFLVGVRPGPEDRGESSTAFDARPVRGRRGRVPGPWRARGIPAPASGGSADRWFAADEAPTRRDDVPHALPAQPAPLRVTSPARVGDGVYVAGDHRDTASIQGALVSGHRVAGVVLADLARR